MATPLSKLQRRTRRTLRITLAWVVIGFLAAFFHWATLRTMQVYLPLESLINYHFWRSLAWGIVGGGVYIFVLRDRLRRLPFLTAYGLMSLFVLAVVCSYHFGPVLLHHTKPDLAWTLADLLYRDLLMGATMMMVRLNDQFGSGGPGFLLGRYAKARQELRVFMFLDMRSSTTIAEQIGDTRYFQLLNEVYADITDPVIYSEGDIYQYVGDEISVSWRLHQGIKGQRCLRCFFAIRGKLEQRAAHYRQRYGIVPVFKAGLHVGQVTSGEVGLVKKQVIYSGDAVNTAAHIQAACNEHGVDNLISKELLDVLVLPQDRWEVRPIGEVGLKGKRHTMALFTVSPITAK